MMEHPTIYYHYETSTHAFVVSVLKTMIWKILFITSSSVLLVMNYDIIDMICAQASALFDTLILKEMYDHIKFVIFHVPIYFA